MGQKFYLSLSMFQFCKDLECCCRGCCLYFQLLQQVVEDVIVAL